MTEQTASERQLACGAVALTLPPSKETNSRIAARAWLFHSATSRMDWHSFPNLAYGTQCQPNYQATSAENGSSRKEVGCSGVVFSKACLGHCSLDHFELFS